MESLYNTLVGTMADVGSAIKAGKEAKEAKETELAKAEKEQAKAIEQAQLEQQKVQAEAMKKEAKKKKAKEEAKDLATSTYLSQKGFEKGDISTIMAGQKTGLGKDVLIGKKQEGVRRKRLSQIMRELARQSKDDALLQRYFGKGEITEETLMSLGSSKAERQTNLLKLYGGKK